MRRGMIGRPLLTARSTSRLICGELLAFAEKTRTITRHWLITRVMASPHFALGVTSRGAIQQRIPLLSSAAHAASAAVFRGWNS
jgi:hypothetical protein